MSIFIQWESLDFKKNSGHEKMRCPNCDNDRADKRDKSLYVYHNEGYGKCFYCEALTFNPERDGNKQAATQKTYTPPPQTWSNYTSLSDNVVKYLSSRGISQRVLNEMKITEERQYQPALQKEATNIVFNYFEGDVLVNKKYRSSTKNFTQTKGGKPILYNINSTIGADEVWIVEGEIDALSLIEAGLKNVTSIPNGANDNDDYWVNSESYLKNVKRFVIGTDMDEKGVAVREKIVQRLGRYRCSYVEWAGKDANEDLMNGVLDASIKNVKRFPVGGTFTSLDLKDKVMALYHEGLPKTITPKGHWFGDHKNTWSTMRGHLVVATGIPSHGKSSWTDWYLLNLVKDYDFKLSVFSPEHSPLELHTSNFTRMALGKSFWGQNRASEEDVNRYLHWADQRLYFTSAENGEFPTWDWLFAKFKEQLYTYGIDMFLIDAYNKVSFDRPETLQEIKMVLGKLAMFCQMHNVMIFLIAHPTKMKIDEQTGLYRVPTLYDVSGSADFRNQTHDGYTIYRHRTETEDKTIFYNMKIKYGWQGVENSLCEFYYDKDTGRFFPTNGSKCDIDFTTDGRIAGQNTYEEVMDDGYGEAIDSVVNKMYGERDVPF